MVQLSCAIVGEKGSVFSVTIDEGEWVYDLKDSIKAETPNSLKDVAASRLQLFLAKKGGAWLTEADVKKGVKDTGGLTPLDVARAPLNLVGLSEEDVRFRVTKEDAKAGNIPVHVLVLVPRHVRIDIGDTGSRILRYKRYKRWIINTHLLLPVILLVIAIIVSAYGEDSTDEKGCLTPVLPLIGCPRTTNVVIWMVAIMSYLDAWKSKLENMIEEVENETPLRAERREMTEHTPLLPAAAA